MQRQVNEETVVFSINDARATGHTYAGKKREKERENLFLILYHMQK